LGLRQTRGDGNKSDFPTLLLMPRVTGLEQGKCSAGGSTIDLRWALITLKNLKI